MFKKFLIIIAFFLLLFQARADAEFENWLNEYKMSLKGRISEKTLNSVLKDIKLSEKVLDLDSKQPEHYLNFWVYFERMINDRRVRDGKRFIEKHDEFLNKIEEEYKVGKHYLTALFAMETDFGRNTGGFNLLNALATLSFRGKTEERKAFFKLQLTALLKAIDTNKITDHNLKGSWAGAFGYFQFMPATFVMYAKNSNDDDKINLFEHEDAFTSAANYLHTISFEFKKPCIIEVSIPSNFKWENLKDEQVHTLGEWLDMGILPVNFDTFVDKSLKAELIMPEGHLGPSFLAFNNFNVLKHWNKSNYYVISACQLAGAFMGYPKVDRQRFKSRSQPRGKIMLVQEKLMELGLYKEGVDGIIGDKTRKALRKVQLELGLPADGYPTDELLKIWNLTDEEIN